MLKHCPNFKKCGEMAAVARRSALLLLLSLSAGFSSSGQPPARSLAASGSAPAHPPLVCIAILSKWQSAEKYRETLMRTWLSDLDPAIVQYRFFVEEGRLLRHNYTLGPDRSTGHFVGLRADRSQGPWFNNTEQVSLPAPVAPTARRLAPSRRCCPRARGGDSFQSWLHRSVCARPPPARQI
jgi:hypothetical protein